MNMLIVGECRRCGGQTAVLLLSLASLFAACEKTPVSPAVSDVFPEILSAQVAENPSDVLSALVAIRTLNARSVSVEIIGDSLVESCTPSFSVAGDSAVVAVLGLAAQKIYNFQAVSVRDPTNRFVDVKKMILLK